MSSWTKELDDATILATRSGWWHILLFYLLCGLAAIPTSFLVFSQVFTNASPEHWCAPPPELKVLNLEDQLYRNLTVPGKHGVYETCSAYNVDSEEFYTVLHRLIDRSKPSNTTHYKEKPETIPVSIIKEAILSVRSEEPKPCRHGWTFSSELYKRTLVTEYLLVCDKDWLPRTSNSLFWVGSIFGNLFFGWMSDRYGRRPTILLMIFLEVPISIATSFSGNYWIYSGLRILCGLFFPALYQLPFILALELMPPAKRTNAGIVVGMLFATGMCLLAAVAYAIRDWFHLSLATSLPFVLLYGYFWILPESPRWLVGRGRIADAERVFINIAKKNGISLPRGFLITLHKKVKDEEMQEDRLLIVPNGNTVNSDRRISNMITFKPDFIKVTDASEDNEAHIILNLNNDVNDKEDLSNVRVNESQMYESNRDINQEQTLKVPMSTLRRKSIQIVNRLLSHEDDEDILASKIIDDQNSEGDCEASPMDVFRYPNIRKKFFILTFNWVSLGIAYNSLSYNTPNLGVNDYLAFFIGGAVELPSYFIAWRCIERYGRRWVFFSFMTIGGFACLCCALVSEEWPWITVSLAMLGRLSAAASFAVFYVQIGELLPTVLRAQAMGAASFISGIGLLACPYIVYLAVIFRSLPLIIIGVLSLLAGFASLFLPETLNRPLPQTLGDGELFGRNFKIFSCVPPSDDES
ncbi:beta-alanine transporter-like [Zerene cesonia]|uniref:beta-alanine transporter-like n=1 Tax=Zerene cesonia TaxID=33412 RepID=UPI0018E546C2|nr:beta-alanine transporter-like [Zerene cesonia]